MDSEEPVSVRRERRWRINGLLSLLVLCASVGCKDKGPGKTPAKRAVAAKAKRYRIGVIAPKGVPKGGTAIAAVSLKALEPYKVNLEYPLKLTVTGPSDVEPQTEVMGKKDAALFNKREVVLKPSCTVSNSGEHTFKAELRFSVCTAELCELKTEKLTWVARVE